jgi:hypothetical protein
MVRASRPARLGMVAVFCALCFILTGCAKSKVTKENFEKIKNDMTLEQVEAVLGEGTKMGDASLMAAQVGVDVTGGAGPSSTVDYVWERGNNSITVTFRQGKVVQKRSSGF